MYKISEWLELNESGITGPDRPQHFWDEENLVSQSLPMKNLSNKGMSNLAKYLEVAGQDVIHDSRRNATLIRLESKSEGLSYLVLNYDGTWHFERQMG